MGDHPLFLALVRNVPTKHDADFDSPKGVDYRTVIERRPWGTYEVLLEAPNYKVKRIVVDPGQRLSLQMHQVRSEHWVVVAGEAIATLGSEELSLVPNQPLYIPTKTRHRIANPGREPLVFIEVQCGGYLGEDDITRFEDDYHRVDDKPDPGAS
jgi:mannose-6-phosphate isomerase-like protein (cupin superfamily)